VANSTYTSGSKKNSDGHKWVPRSKIQADLVSLFCLILKTPADNTLSSAKNAMVKGVLTKNGVPQAAHLFPYSMLNKPADPSNPQHIAQNSFWDLLGVFWNEDRVAKWRNKIFPNPNHPGVEACFNLISLSAEARWHWNIGCFALKPLEISDDKKKLTVQFFWQPQYSHGSKDPVDLLKEPLSSRDLGFTEKKGIECFLSRQDDRSLRRIESGDIYTITTDDPAKRPLPSWELLEMQWVLQRLTAMSGGAEFDVYDDEDDMGSDSMLIPDDIDDINKPFIHPLDNPGDIRYSFNRVTKWIQRAPPPQGEVPDVAKLATDVLASKSRYMPSAGAAESSSGSVSISKGTLPSQA
jgi:hypothetical protein